ncbi:DUF4232 domain-containing protein [Streptomyces sp. NPDC047123]|uniref:DUF4232 domain-containing protein n=1 Tax=Streptomyces sp. NPDC047123 TaxID=3155622 RepID=UPI0033DDADE4
MRPRHAARSARLVLAAVAVSALAATATACGPDDTTSTDTSTSPTASGGKGGSSAKDGSSDDSDAGSGDSTGKAGPGAGEDKNAGKKDGYGQTCGTNDLTFTLTEESQAGGYYLVAAKAKSGISCSLDVNTPSVSFGSGAAGVASPVGQGGEDPIKLSGSAVAYTGISPKSTNTDGGVQFESVIVSVTDDDPNPAELKLPSPADVDKPIVTNWSTDRAETVPVIA